MKIKNLQMGPRSMPTLQSLMLAILMTASLLAFGGDDQGKSSTDVDQTAAAGAPEAEDNQERIILKVPATSVKQAMERRTKLEVAALAKASGGGWR